MAELPSNSPRVALYTDGGAKPNPGPGGWGAVLLHQASDKRRELSGSEKRTTNNRMELTAAIRGLEALAEPCRVDLYTDSQYLRRGVTQWLDGWIARGWERKTGELKNVDLWKRLAELRQEHRIRWHWLKGHAGHRHNERADQLATAARRELTAGGGRAAEPAKAVEADVELYVKVSCNDGHGGWAVLERHDDHHRVLGGTRRRTTAPELELVAAAEALAALPEGSRVAVYTTSDYLRNGASQWLAGWKRRGFKTADGQPVKNAESWRRLDRVQGARRVLWPAPGEEEKLRLKEVAKEARKRLAAGRRGGS